MRKPFQILLLLGVVLLLYLPTLSAGVSYVDDRDIFAWLLNRDGWRLMEIFLPKTAAGLYYRPLIDLSLVFDRQVWFLSERFMHLENILVHCLNTLLVYFLVDLLIRSDSVQTKRPGGKNFLPLSAALLFGIHPLNTEAVNLICGRCDLLAGTFVLASALLLLTYKLSPRRWTLCLAVFALFLGALCKEVALAFLPAVVVILRTAPFPASGQVGTKRQRRSTNLVWLSCIAVAIAGGVIVLRSLAFTSTTAGIGDSIRYMFVNPVHCMYLVLGAFGFYLRKISFPYPLNFAITEVDPLYELLGLACIVVCWLIVQRRSLSSAIFLAGVLLILPAFAIVFNDVAWTAYAERYTYLPTAFLVPVAVLTLGTALREQLSGRVLCIAVVALLVTASGTTWARNELWRDPLLLLRDTVENTPDFHMVRNNYGIALMDRGDYNEARIQFKTACKLFRSSLLPILNLGDLYYLQGDRAAAVAQYELVLKRSAGTSAKAHRHMADMLERELLRVRDKESARNVRERLLRTYDALYGLEKNPHLLYRSGQLLLASGKRGEAARYFVAAEARLSDGDEFKRYAQTVIARLRQ
jgi:tetratricopeptide (TPR) repeat protein